MLDVETGGPAGTGTVAGGVVEGVAGAAIPAAAGRSVSGAPEVPALSGWVAGRAAGPALRIGVAAVAASRPASGEVVVAGALEWSRSGDGLVSGRPEAIGLPTGPAVPTGAGATGRPVLSGVSGPGRRSPGAGAP